MDRKMISLSVIVGMRNVSDKSYKENQNTIYYVWKYFSKMSLWDIVVKYCRAGQVTAGNMAHAHCILTTKGLETHTVYVVLIAIPLQQWLHEST